MSHIPPPAPRPPADGPKDRRTDGPKPPPSGFSLIEVMVATTVLAILVLMLGGVFQQASSSWDAGFVRAEGGMAVRAVVGALARDLSTAVDGRRFGLSAPVEVPEGGGSTITMIRLKAGPGDGGRDIQKIQYVANGSTVTRKILEGAADDEDPSSVIYSQPDNAGANGAIFTFSPGPAADYGRYYEDEEFDSVKWTVPSVKVRCKLTREGVFSGLTVRSVGRDAMAGTKDDIVVQ